MATLSTPGLGSIEPTSRFDLPSTYTIDQATNQRTYTYSDGSVVLTFDTDGNGIYDQLEAYSSTLSPILNLSGVNLGNYFGGDVIYYGAAIRDSAENAIETSENADSVYLPVATNTVATFAGADLVVGAALVDVIDGGADNDVLYGGGGRDQLTGGDGDDFLEGGDNEDLLLGGIGADTLYAGEGLDNLLGGGVGDDVLYGGSGNDSLDGGDGNDTFYGYGGNEHVLADDGGDVVFGGDGNDAIGGGSGSDSIDGGAGDDVLDGGPAGDDALYGGDGNDFIGGYAGSDFIYVGAGADIVRFEDETASIDTVFDFTPGTDLIYNQTSRPTERIIATAQVIDGDTILDLRNDQTVILVGVTGIDASWFLAA